MTADPTLRPVGARAHARAFVGRWFPPSRVTWLVLAVLAGYEVAYFRGLGLLSLIALPALGVVLDLTFQAARFSSLRVPDSAVATGLFVALLLPPTVPLVWAGTAVIVGLAAKHIVRRAGRPWMNPAAFGTLVAIAIFGLAPAWWVTVNTPSEVLMVAGGAVLLARTPVNWRLPATFFGVYAALWTVTHFTLLLGTPPQVLALGLLDPVMLFFGLYMVSEPRTAPRRPPDQFPYAGTVALTGVLANFLLPNEGPLVGLVVTGLGLGIAATVYDRLYARAGAGTDRERAPGHKRRAGVGRSPRALVPTVRWGTGRRVAAGFLVLFLLAGIFVVAPPGSSLGAGTLRGLPPGGAGGAGSTAASTQTCTADNPAIPSSSLSVLHQALGPSVILSYDPATGVTVFYDPVDHVTVTETDLYEDYGYAEFNGDDSWVAGCHP